MKKLLPSLMAAGESVAMMGFSGSRQTTLIRCPGCLVKQPGAKSQDKDAL